MESDVIKKYILIVVIVIVNIILIILTSVSVLKSINKIARGEVKKSQFEKTYSENDENFEEQEEVAENDYTEEDMSFDFSLQNFLQLKEYINTRDLQLCILIIIGINLFILAILIYKKI